VAEDIADVHDTCALKDAHGGQNTDGVLERQSQEEVGLCEFGTEDTHPETVRHPHIVSVQMGEAGGEGLTGHVLPTVLPEIAAEETAERLDREENCCEQRENEVHNTESETHGVLNLLGTELVQETENDNTGDEIDDKDGQKEHETLSQMLSTGPATRNVTPFANCREDLDKGGKSTTKANSSQVFGRGRLVVPLLLVIGSVESRGVVSGEEPERDQVNDPDTVEVGDHVEPRTRLLVGLEECLLPNDILQLGPTLLGGNIDQSGLVLEVDPFNTLRVPEQLVHIIITNDLVVVILTANILSVQNLVSLITAVLV